METPCRRRPICSKRWKSRQVNTHLIAEWWTSWPKQGPKIPIENICSFTEHYLEIRKAPIVNISDYNHPVKQLRNWAVKANSQTQSAQNRSELWWTHRKHSKPKDETSTELQQTIGSERNILWQRAVKTYISSAHQNNLLPCTAQHQTVAAQPPASVVSTKNP